MVFIRGWIRVRDQKYKYEAEVTEESCYTTGFEGVERGRKPRNANKLQKLEKGKKWIFPQISRRNTSANNLILAQLS